MQDVGLYQGYQGGLSHTRVCLVCTKHVGTRVYAPVPEYMGLFQGVCAYAKVCEPVLGCMVLYWGMLVRTRLYWGMWAVPECARVCGPVSGYVGLYQGVLSYTRVCCPIPGYVGGYQGMWAVPGCMGPRQGVWTHSA